MTDNEWLSLTILAAILIVGWWVECHAFPDFAEPESSSTAGVPAPDVIERFVAQQEPLGEPFTKVLMDNLPDLYSKDGVHPSSNDQRQVRKDNQGLGEPGRLSPSAAGAPKGLAE